MANSTLKTIHPWLQENTTETPSGATIKSYSHDNGSDPILCIVHGYPQSSYQWRHVLPAWKNDYTLFIPELPGYGKSTLPSTSTSTSPPTYNKRTIGEAILSALHNVLGPSSQTRPIHWIAHDRGARIGHRLLTSPSPPANLKSAVFIDIVPTLEQWRAFAHPAASVAYFHWPFLAMGTAPQVIKGMGGEAFCRMILARGRGANSLGHRKIDSEDAYDHYAKIFDRDEAIEGSCADYAGGAVEECQAQEEEQAAGQKVRVPLLVIYSEGSLGKMNDVEGIWPKWAEKGVEGVRFVGVGDGHGHYLPESADGLVAEKVVEFVKRGLEGTKL